MMTEEHSTSRVCPRCPCTGAAELLRSGKLCGWGKVSEISRTGCYIETDHPLPIGTEVQLHLTIAGTVLDIGANVVWITPQVGMGLRFEVMHPGDDNKLAAIIEEVTATGHAPAAQQAERPQAGSATLPVTRDAAPDILEKIIQQIERKGVLTRQELLDIMKKANP